MKSVVIKNFNPKNKTYYFNGCDEYFCHKTKYGVCSLDLSETEVINRYKKYVKTRYDEEYDVNYCIKIYKSIIEEGQKYPIYLNLMKCGHYIFTDGQHRTCIAAKKNLNLNVELDIIDDICYECSEEKDLMHLIDVKKKRVLKTTPKRNIIHKLLKIYPQSEYMESLDSAKNQLEEFLERKERNLREF